MHDPRAPELRATYRVQLHAGFTLRDATAIVPYLDALGVSHLYASPVFAARPGSQHGYDVVDPDRVNPELGSEGDLVALAESLHGRGMGLLVDIVPNHMGIGAHNRYWEDVLTHGERSPYARWFDIAWDMHDDRKLVLPILGDDLDRVIERGELTVEVNETGARLHHFGHSLPVSPDTEPESLQLAQWDPAAEREAESEFAQRDQLRALLARQHYRLLDWRKGPREINYRRFFDVNDLVALRMEDPEVFRQTHAYVLDLVRRGVIDGLRVDHVDGLRQPLAYLRQLRDETDRRRPGGVPIFVEKILMGEERLRTDWPVEGTTGYERLNDIEDLFIDADGFARLEDRYRARRRSRDLSFGGTVRADKRAVLARSFAADVERLARLLGTILRADGREVSRAQVFHGIEEYIAACPVYRTYIDPASTRSAEDMAVLASMELLADESTIANRIRSLMKGSDGADPVQAEFIARMQQLTGPATAKGLEDTAHYAYIPLVSRNEVGGAPDRPLDDIVSRFHESNRWFAEHFPRSLVTTSTHDTKRSGDVRARISALSEIAAEWERSVARWRRLNRRHQKVVRGRIVPDPNAELLVYQTLAGIWPGPRQGRRADDVPEKAWRTAALARMKQYVLKAVREANLRTSWTEPDEEYEKALLEFVAAILDAAEDDPFLSDLSRLVSRIVPLAYWNTLTRVLLHLTIPGTPDIYQGDESWNFALVDPDNRRPVNYTARQSSLGAVAAMTPPASVAEMSGQVNAKAWLTHRVLDVRKQHARLFAEGGYHPLVVRGPHARHIVAFERRLDGARALIVAPRLVNVLTTVRDWAEMSIQLPDRVKGTLRCAITGREAAIRDERIEVEGTFEGVPFGLFLSS
ncbi:MAG TPA: malto-oligosyltrehalose synthase [Gemmatimonadaceae bacterium]|nr:malto-oligosyltrehalose synthase [Gemmatimonadaceae bacterium]